MAKSRKRLTLIVFANWRKSNLRMQKAFAFADETFAVRYNTLEYMPIPALEYDLKKISGEENTYRVRLSSFRVLYKIFPEERVVRVTKIEKRSDATYA